MKAYFLRGLEDDILVFRSLDPEDLLRIIRRLGASRDKEMKALSHKLETEFYSGHLDRRYPQQVEQENPKPGAARTRKRTRKNAPPKPGTN